MASISKSPGALESPIPVVMDLKLRENNHPECIAEDGALDERNFAIIQAEGISGKAIIEGTYPQSIAPEEGTGFHPHAVPRDVIDPEAPIKYYEYAPLSKRDAIRCLVLESGTGDADEPLICNLHHHSLDDNPDFEAISYVWGSSHKAHMIICDGRRIAVTKNLHACLLRTRLPDRTRTLWADSICINQDDLQEKGHQVGLMCRIYSEARRVLIFLGPDEHGHAKDAAGLVSDVCPWVQKTVSTKDGEPHSFPFTNQTEWPCSDRRWESLSSMTGLSWFARGWVVQEAGLAKDAQILWGRVEMDWIDVMRVLWWLMSRAPTMLMTLGFSFSPVLHMTAYLTKHPAEASVVGHPQTYTLLEILDWGRKLQFEDNRDRIYAFLGLPEAAAAWHALKVNYKLPYLHVYSQFASWYINTTQDMGLLEFVYHDNDTLLADVPSWVPQWHVLRGGHRLKLSSSKPILPVSKGPDYTALAAVQGNLLKVHGLLIDHIVWTSRVVKDDVSIEEIVELWAWFEEHSKDCPYGAVSPVLAFLEAIQSGTRYPRVEAHMIIANDAEYVLRLQEGKPVPSHPSLDSLMEVAKKYHGDATTTHYWVRKCIGQYRLCLTARGYYGVIPAVAQEGDVCCIVFGTKSPFIIRQNEPEGHYKVIGEAFFVSARLKEGAIYPSRVGSGPWGHEDWLEWNLKEQEILLC